MYFWIYTSACPFLRTYTCRKYIDTHTQYYTGNQPCVNRVKYITNAPLNF